MLSFSPVLLSPALDSHTPAKAVSQKLYISHSAPPSQPCTNNAGRFPSITYRKVGRGAHSRCIGAKAACMSSAGIHMTSHSSRHNPTFGKRRMRSRYRGGACIRVCKFFLSFPFTAFFVQHFLPSFRALERNSGTKPLGLPRKSARGFRHLFVSLSYTTSVSF